MSWLQPAVVSTICAMIGLAVAVAIARSLRSTMLERAPRRQRAFARVRQASWPTDRQLHATTPVTDSCRFASLRQPSRHGSSGRRTAK